MAQVELRSVSKSYGPVRAVRNIDLTFEEGSFTTLLGPSGCGKTTILRMVAGLEVPSEGDILIGDQRINDVPIHQRNLGLVFQNYALFPHKTIEQNIGFGLKYRDVSKADMHDKVREALEIVRLPGVEDRYPSQLSGGQQQRIALARAIVIEPSVLLLDEPLSALDANLREEMRVELTAIQQRIGVTTIFVTHDQSEALAMSDRIIVMSEGRVEQSGKPEQVYNAPLSEFVARFLGAANILEANVVACSDQSFTLTSPVFGAMQLTADAGAAPDHAREVVRYLVRAEKIKLTRPDETQPDSVSGKGIIEAVDYQGQVARYFVRSDDVQLQVVDMIEDHPFAHGTEVGIHVRLADCRLLQR